MDVWALLFCLLLAQQPGDGWALVHETRQVRRLYWDLFQTTEIWLRLIPEDPTGKPPLVNLLFQAFFPGRAERDPYSGLPQEPKGPPARLVLKALPLPMTVSSELSLQLVIDGKTIDLMGPGARYQYLYPTCAEGCPANGVEAELEPSILSSLLTAQSVGGKALGFPIRLTADDQVALADFAARINLIGEKGPNK